MQHQTETQDQTEKQDDTEIQFQIQIQDPSQQARFHNGRPDERYRTENIEKKQHKVKIHPTGNIPQPKTTKRYCTEKIEKKQHKAKCLTGKVPQPKAHRMVSHREDQKDRTAQANVSHRQSSTTEEQEKGFAQRRCKRSSTKPSISQARFLNRKQQNGIGQ